MNGPTVSRTYEEVKVKIDSGDFDEKDMQDFMALAQSKREARQDRNNKVNQIRKLIEDLNTHEATAITSNDIITLFSPKLLSDVAQTMGLAANKTGEREGTQGTDKRKNKKNEGVKVGTFKLADYDYEIPKKDVDKGATETELTWVLNEGFKGQSWKNEFLKIVRDTGPDKVLEKADAEFKKWVFDSRKGERGANKKIVYPNALKFMQSFGITKADEAYAKMAELEGIIFPQGKNQSTVHNKADSKAEDKTSNKTETKADDKASTKADSKHASKAETAKSA